MPFGSITVNSKTFAPRDPGTYANTTVGFGQPEDELRVRGSVTTSKDGLLRGSITRVLEKDIADGSDQVRKQLIVNVTVSVPPSGFTATEIDECLLEISEFATVDTVTRILQGES